MFDFISRYQLSSYPLLLSFVLVHCVFEKLPLSDKLSNLIGIKFFLISSSLIRNTNSKTMMWNHKNDVWKQKQTKQ